MKIPHSTERLDGSFFHFNRRQVAALARLAEIYPESGARPSPSEFNAALDTLGASPTMLDMARTPIRNVERGNWVHHIVPKPRFSAKDLPEGVALKPADEHGTKHLLADSARLWWQNAYESWPANDSSREARETVQMATTVGDGHSASPRTNSSRRELQSAR